MSSLSRKPNFSNFEIIIDDSLRFMTITPDKYVTTASALYMIRNAARLRVKNKIKKFVFDLSNTETKAGDHYFFAYKKLQSSDADKETEIVIVARDDDKYHWFVERVMRNEGYNIRKFTTVEDARSYVLNGVAG